ncbi:unnamed protein product [Lampetra fluviatilis]
MATPMEEEGSETWEPSDLLPTSSSVSQSLEKLTVVTRAITRNVSIVNDALEKILMDKPLADELKKYLTDFSAE